METDATYIAGSRVILPIGVNMLSSRTVNQMQIQNTRRVPRLDLRSRARERKFMA